MKELPPGQNSFFGPAEIQGSDVSSRKRDPAGQHWRLLLVILHNNKASSYHWQNKNANFVFILRLEKMRCLVHMNRIGRFTAIRIDPLTFPFIFRFGNQDSIGRKSPWIFPWKRCKCTVSHCRFFVFAIRTRSCNVVRYVQKCLHESPSCYLCQSVFGLS